MIDLYPPRLWSVERRYLKGRVIIVCRRRAAKPDWSKLLEAA